MIYDDRYEYREGRIVDLQTNKSYSARDVAKFLFSSTTNPPLGEDEMPNALRPMDLNKGLPDAISKRVGGTDQEGDPSNMDAATLIEFVKLCAAGLDPDEKVAFYAALSQLLDMDASRTAGDRRFSSRGHRPAQDSALAAIRGKDFARRFPFAADIRFSGNGR